MKNRSFPFILALAFLLTIHNSDTFPGFFSGMGEQLNCSNYFSPWPRLKMLDCNNVCPSVRLQQIRTSLKGMRWSWLPGVSSCPQSSCDSPLVIPRSCYHCHSITSEHTHSSSNFPAVGTTCCPCPSPRSGLIPRDTGCHLLPGSWRKSVTMVTTSP